MIKINEKTNSKAKTDENILKALETQNELLKQQNEFFSKIEKTLGKIYCEVF